MGLPSNLKGVRFMYFPYQLLSFELGFQGFNFLLSVKFLLAEGFAGLKLVILQPNGEELSTFPASVGTLIA